MYLTCVDDDVLLQYLEVEGEAELQQGVASQPRAWGTIPESSLFILGCHLLLNPTDSSLCATHLQDLQPCGLHLRGKYGDHADRGVGHSGQQQHRRNRWAWECVCFLPFLVTRLLIFKCRQNYLNANKPSWSFYPLSHSTALFSVTMLRHTHSTSLRLQVFKACVSPLVAWRNTLEDWAPEDWSEDVSVSQIQTMVRLCSLPALTCH